MSRLLLIDDDDLLRSVVSKALAHAGHTVMQAPDGRQGIDIARVAKLDLVITDLVMPVQEGVETIVQLRRDHPGLPIIAISGGLTNSDFYLEIAARIGAKRVLAKPFTPQELIVEIEAVLAEGETT